MQKIQVITQTNPFDLDIQLSLVGTGQGEIMVICMGHTAWAPKGRSQEAQRASS